MRVAFADSDEATGFGASCDMGSAYNARLTALATCIAQSKTVCWTDSTFNGGGDERSKSENGEFDLTWYIQGMLHGLGYDPGTTDGEFGNRTRTAIRAFQSDIGIEQTGEATEDLLYIMLGKSGGIGFLVATHGDAGRELHRRREVAALRRGLCPAREPDAQRRAELPEHGGAARPPRRLPPLQRPGLPGAGDEDRSHRPRERRLDRDLQQRRQLYRHPLGGRQERHHRRQQQIA